MMKITKNNFLLLPLVLFLDVTSSFTSTSKVRSTPSLSTQPAQQRISRFKSTLPTNAIPTIFSRAHSRLHLGLQTDAILLAQQVGTNVLDAYGNLLRQYPIATKSITAAILACAGDAIAQFRSESEEYDWKRGLCFSGFGALYTGAFQHFWFTYMTNNIADWGDILGLWGPQQVDYPIDLLFDKDQWWRYFDILAALENPPSDIMLAASKLAVNQFAAIPFVYMPLFFSLTGALAGLDINQSIARAQSLYLPLLQRNWAFWLPVQFLQFLVIPEEFQIPFLSTASLVWTVILSSIGSQTPPATQTVAYETVREPATGEEIITVTQVDAGAANQITDYVTFEDVEKTFLPEKMIETARNVSGDAKLVTGGFAAGLLASAADEGAIGAAIGELINVEADIGVAVAAALGAGVALLVASSSHDSTGQGSNSTSISAVNENDDDNSRLEQSQGEGYLKESVETRSDTNEFGIAEEAPPEKLQKFR